MSTTSESTPVKTTGSKAGAARGSLSPFSQRLLVASIILFFGSGMVIAGGWIFFVLIMILLLVSAWEYWRLYSVGGYRPSALIIIGGVLTLAITRQLWGFETGPLILTGCVLLNMGFLVFDYRAAQKTAAVDFNLNLGGVVYLGWLGSYLISLRSLPNGLHWLMLVIPATALCDGGAYVIGSLMGKHKFAPLISPKKSWEGYIGGLIFGTFGAAGLAAAWHLAAPVILPWHGLVIGAAVSLLTPLGDLGESMIKRGFGVKDSGTVLPGHGGMLDRIDSWLWAAPIGYYIITLFFLH